MKPYSNSELIWFKNNKNKCFLPLFWPGTEPGRTMAFSAHWFQPLFWPGTACFGSGQTMAFSAHWFQPLFRPGTEPVLVGTNTILGRN